VFLQRLLSEFLTSIPDDDMPNAMALMRQSSVDIRTLVEHLRKYTSAHDSDFQPFQISFPNAGHVYVKISPRITTWTGFQDERATSWARGPHAGMITVDMSKLQEATSTVLAWLVQIAQVSPSKYIWLESCSPTIARSISILKVGKMLKIIGGAGSPSLSLT
jgi:hypothetical protein